jgi:two-component system CheB/CheR fusion protein
MSSASAAALAPAPVEVPRPEPDLRLHLIKRRALVVDDSPDVADMLTIVLRQEGYEVETAYSASQALMAAFTRRFDVIVSDIGMPGMDGYELARRLRELPEYRATPMVAVTGFASYDDRERSLGEGFTAHLSKPVDPATLTRALSGSAH